MSLGVQVTSDDAAVSKLSAMTRGYIKDEFLPFFVRKAAKRSPLINRGACRGGGMAVAHAPRARTHTRLHIHTQEKTCRAGYYARVAAIELLVQRFVAASSSSSAAAAAAARLATSSAELGECGSASDTRGACDVRLGLLLRPFMLCCG